MKTKEEGKQFYLFINKLRLKRRCSLQQLCEGLCTSQEASYLESGKRLLNKLLQDAIVERLGIGAEDYEHFLGYMEYDRWEARQRILHNITFEQGERAKGLLMEYCAKYVEDSGTEKRLEHKSISQQILSLKELNLILEAEQYREGGERLSRYREVVEYIEGAGMDGRGMAKIYPKAVFFLCRCRIAARGYSRYLSLIRQCS